MKKSNFYFTLIITCALAACGNDSSKDPKAPNQDLEPQTEKEYFPPDQGAPKDENLDASLSVTPLTAEEEINNPELTPKKTPDKTPDSSKTREPFTDFMKNLMFDMLDVLDYPSLDYASAVTIPFAYTLMPSSYAQSESYLCAHDNQATCLSQRKFVDDIRFAWIRTLARDRAIKTIEIGPAADQFEHEFLDLFITTRVGMHTPLKINALNNEILTYPSEDPAQLAELAQSFAPELCDRAASSVRCQEQERCNKAIYFAAAFEQIKNDRDLIKYLNEGRAPIFRNPTSPSSGVKLWTSCEEAAKTYGDLYDGDIGGTNMVLKPQAEIVTSLNHCNDARGWVRILNFINFDDYFMYQNAEWAPDFIDMENPQKGVAGWMRCYAIAPLYTEAVYGVKTEDPASD